jgi:hypothetical protein
VRCPLGRHLLDLPNPAAGFRIPSPFDTILLLEQIDRFFKTVAEKASASECEGF